MHGSARCIKTPFVFMNNPRRDPGEIRIGSPLLPVDMLRLPSRRSRLYNDRKAEDLDSCNAEIRHLSRIIPRRAS